MCDAIYEKIQRNVEKLEFATFNGDEKAVYKIQHKLNEQRAILLKMPESSVMSSSSYIPYPDIGETRFHQTLNNKKEFRQNHYEKLDINKSYEEISNNACDQTKFKLSPNQVFLKNFMSPKSPYNGVLIFAGTGVGKCSIAGTEILMHDGSIKSVETVVVGDALMGDDSTKRVVLCLGRGRDTMYKVCMEHEESFTVNADHILCVKLIDASDDDIYELSVEQYLKIPLTIASCLRVYQTRIHYPSTPVSLDKFDVYSMSNIPTDYIVNSADVRNTALDMIEESLIAHNSTITLMKDSVLQQIKSLARSLGHHCYVKQDQMRIIRRGIFDFKFRFKINPVGIADYFGFTLDCNNRYVMSNYIVTHNTCTAISIAEQYKDVFDKRTLLILPDSIKEQFYTQVYDSKKDSYQCTGNTYVDMFPPNMSEEHKAIRTRKVLKRHYELMGYQRFGNIMEKEQSRKMNDKINWIRETFSDRMVIIDEVHNVRLDTSQKKDSDHDEDIVIEKSENKRKGNDPKVPPLLRMMLRYAENVKLVMLSATPMFDTADEIINIINYLLSNDKRTEVEYSDVFDKKKNLLPNGASILATAFQGYVSFMRGNNPFSFPIKLSPSFNKDNLVIQDKDMPTHDVAGDRIANGRLEGICIIKSIMCKEHSEIYKTVRSNEKEHSKDATSIQTLPQISNIVYPAGSGSNLNSDRDRYGSKGFDACFHESKSNNKTTSYTYLSQNYHCLDQNHISDHSPKIKTIIDYIEHSTGIVFVFSYYKKSGIIPLAIALEHMGYQRFTSGDTSVKSMLNGNDPRSRDFKQYCTLTGDTKDMQSIVDALKHPSNKHGKQIKVILGTSVTSEGLDLKNIREVHFLDPWFNFSRINQVVGRAIRTCSHASLSVKERNVTVFYHASVVESQPESTHTESDDLFRYRIAKRKARDITIIEKILQENAVDCHANINSIRLDAKFKIEVESSQRVTETVDLFEYEKIYMAMHCISLFDSTQLLDDSTYDESHFYQEVNACIDMIRSVFNDNDYYFTYVEIRAQLMSQKGFIVKYTLDKMIKEKTSIMRRHRKGYIIYRDDLYVFQDLDMHLKTIHRDRKEIPSPHVNLVVDGERVQKQVQENVQDMDMKDRSSIVSLEKTVVDEYANFACLSLKIDCFYDYAIDRLSFEALSKLVEQVMRNKLDAVHPVMSSLMTGHILESFNNGTIWLFAHVHKFIKLGKHWSEDANPFTDNENSTYHLSVWKHRDQTFKSKIEESDRELFIQRHPSNERISYTTVHGFVTFNKDKLEFKLVNPHAIRPVGSVCENNSKLKNADLATTILKEFENPAASLIDHVVKYTKPKLCMAQELIMRNKVEFFVRPLRSFWLQ